MIGAEDMNGVLLAMGNPLLCITESIRRALFHYRRKSEVELQLAVEI
jgi:hypothetical protein